MEYLGYLVAAVLVPVALGGAIVVLFKDKRRIQNIEISPWRVRVEFEKRDN